MMKYKEYVAGGSDNEFDVDEPEEVGDYSDGECSLTDAAKTTGKRGQPSKSTPLCKNKKPKVFDGRGEEEIQDSDVKEDEFEEDVDTEQKVEVEEEWDEQFEEDENSDEEWDEEINQGPNTEPATEFTKGAFVVLKSDLGFYNDPPIWKIKNKRFLQKYLPFIQDGKILYSKTAVFSHYSSNFKDVYYSAPVSFIQHTSEEHIIEFYKDKIKKDPNVEKATKEFKEKEAELAGNDNK